MGKLRRIGVLGGMGPEATIALMQRLQVSTPANDDADHIPLLVDMNTQIPSRILHLIEKTGPNPGPTMAEMALRLQTAGAKALVMPCNTAHYYANFITSNVTIPFLHMPEMTCDELARQVAAGADVGILASPATNQTGLFQTLLSERELGTIWPSDEDAVLATIRRLKSSGPTSREISELQDKADELIERGAAAILIGCTEFSLVSDQIKASVPIIDALDVLVAATLKFAGVRPS